MESRIAAPVPLFRRQASNSTAAPRPHRKSPRILRPRPASADCAPDEARAKPVLRRTQAARPKASARSSFYARIPLQLIRIAYFELRILSGWSSRRNTHYVSLPQLRVLLEDILVLV